MTVKTSAKIGGKGKTGAQRKESGNWSGYDGGAEEGCNIQVSGEVAGKGEWWIID
jgi:hypothetical protein